MEGVTAAFDSQILLQKM